MLKTLYVFNASNTQIGNITEYADDTVTKTLDNTIAFELTAPFTPTTKSLLVTGNRIQVDSDIFIISQIEDIKSQSEYYRHCICEGLHYELSANLIKASHSYTGIVALFQAATAGSGWSVVLEGSYTPPNDLDMTAPSTLVHVWDYENSLKILNDLSEKWKVEVAYTADVVSSQITNKKIHLYQQRGATRTAQYTFSKNIESLKKTTDFTGIETRIIGVGAVLSSDGTNNTYRDFKDAVWTTAAGKPVNKPAGQNYVEDAAAVALYGIRTGTYKLNTIDAAKLLTNSWRSLQARKQPYIGYEVSVGDLYSLIGDSNYTCNIGDTIPIYDADLDINITARVKELSYSPNDGTLTKVTLNNYRRLVDVDTIQDMQEDADATQSYVVGEIGKTNASITVQAGEIALKVSTETFDALENRVTVNETDITQLDDKISLRATTSYVDTQNAELLAAADAAQDAADAAQETADAAKAYTDNLAADSVITQGEKITLKQTWDLIVDEATLTTGKIPAQAIQFGVAHTAFDTAYSTLNTYITTTLNLFASMTTAKTGIVRTTWNNNWKNYYNARTDLLNAIADKAKQLADDAEGHAQQALLELEPEQIRLKVGQIGGNNLILNGKCDFGVDSWGTSNATRALSNSSVLGRQVFRVVATAANGSMTQTVSGLIVGNWYTISARVSKDTGATQARILTKMKNSANADVWSTRVTKTTNGWEIVKATFQAIEGPVSPTAAVDCTFYFNTVGEGYGSGWTDIKLEEGVNATIWTPNASELRSSSMSITNDTVAIDTQNFNLTLRDSSNNPSLVIDANSKAFNTQNTVGTMSLSGNSLKGLLTDGFWVTSQSNWGWYLRNRFTKETADALTIEGYDNGSNDYGVLFTMGTPFDFMDFGSAESILRIRKSVKTFAGGWTEGKATFNSDVYFTGFQLKELDWTNKIQSGATTSNATANTTSTVTFPTAFPAGSVVRVSLTARGNATAYLAAAATNTSFTFRCSAPSTICEWIAVAQQD